MVKAPPKVGAPRTKRKAWRTSTKTSTERGYGWDYQKARKRLLQDEPLCRECLKNGRVTVARIADHVIPLAQGGSRSANNLQPLCAPCHRAKTLSEAQAGKQRRL
jgi:5-methylcytosine-specific restriction protein A